uniref:Right handed beta helix domain-containing protein n=1 Tax=Amphimedon queenslandica TaxID=400682 RepID=A0A1X7UB66_AMPQE
MCTITGDDVFEHLLSLLLSFFSVSSLTIRIDEDGNDSIDCLIEQPQSSCQSLKYVADAFSNTGNLTIEIISPTLSIQSNVKFTDINRLTINGQGESLTTIQVQSVTAGISFLHCGEVVLANFILTTVTEPLLCDSHHNTSEDQCSFTTNGNYSLFFLNPKELMIKNCNFTSSNDTHAAYNGTLIKLSNTTVGLKVLLYNSFYNTLYVNNTKFMNNKIGFDVIAINSSNSSISVTASQFNGNKYHGLKISYDKSCHNNFTIFGCTFSNNTGCNGVSMNLVLAKNSTSNIFHGFGSRFIHNSAKYAGGGVNIDLSPTEGYHNTYPSNNTITFEFCYFNNNSGSYAGGVGIVMASVSLDYKKKANYIKFRSCKFEYNKASSGSAVHVNRNIPNESGIILWHSMIRPFENKWHNYLDLFLLINLVLFNMLTISNYFISVWKTDQEMYIGIPIPVIHKANRTV